LFSEPLGIATDAHRKNVGDALRGWQMFINDAARARGWKLDNTSDLPRVLRVPGSLNHKLGAGQRCDIIAVNDIRYLPSDFSPYIRRDNSSENSDIQSGRGPDYGQAGFSGKVGASAPIVEKCIFIQYCRDNATRLPEPYWHAMISNLALCSDGRERIHEFSGPYPGYSANETDKKIRHALSERKPHTCAYIQSALGFDCGNCPAGRKAPVALAVVTRADEVRALLEAEITEWAKVFDNDYIAALSYAKSKLPGDYAKFKMRLKGKVNIMDLEKCIRAYDEKFKGHAAGAADELLLLDGIDLNGAVIPHRWQVSAEGGVRRAFTSKDAEVEVIACPNPVVVTRRLVNLDDGKERLELRFRRDGQWKPIVANRTTVYNKSSIIGLGDAGLHVTSSTAPELVNYLSDYEITNAGVIPRVSSISRLGWLDDGQFFPYAIAEEIIFEEDNGTATLYRNLCERGDYATWLAMMRELRKNSVARFISAASFASPLLCKIGVRTFVIHLWHTSGSGKSAALKAAISVWGNPLRIMGNGFTTIVGTEQLAGTLRNLPFGIDEKQSADERRLSLEQLVYVLGQGSGKIRGARGGGNADVATWHNTVMLTGEEPITRNSSLDGIQTRTFEIYGRPIDDMDFAKGVHIVSENNYGFAGALFMRAICAVLRENPEYLRQEYLRFATVLRDKGLKNIHADYVAAVALGDYLAETIVFGTDKETAIRGAIDCGVEVYAMNEAQLSADAVERAWDFVSGWLISNEGRFSHDATPYYGKTSETPGGKSVEFFVIPQYLDAALEDAGFNIKKTMQGFRERGLIVTQKDSGGSVRTKTVGRIDDKMLRGYVFRIQRQGVMPLVGNKSHDD